MRKPTHPTPGQIQCKFETLMVVFIFMVFAQDINGQSLSDVGTGKIVELESVQSKITGTFIIAAMERSTNYSTKVIIYRSTNNAYTWSVIDSIIPNPGDSEIPDPVLTTDALGNFYLAVMRVNYNINASFTTSDVEVYKSENDGLSWLLVGIPHFADSIADYPQFMARNNGELYLTYSYMRGFPAINKSTLIFKKSNDGGNSWTPATFLGSDTLKCIGAGITQGFNNRLLISEGSINSSYIYCYASDDFGISWDSLGRFSIFNDEKAHITKPVTNPDFDFYGILSHKPHKEQTTIFYHAIINGNHYSQILDSGSYAQGYITGNGIVHIVYNKNENNLFKLLYTYSADSGLTFVNPIPLYSHNYSISANGEYQSLLFGNDSLFYLTFCDWSDNSRAKTLVFDPQALSSIYEIKKANNLIIYPNPVSDAFSLILPNNLQLTRVKVINLKGQIMKQWLPRDWKPSTLFNISYLDNDLYLVVVEIESVILVQKIIKY